MGVQALAHPSFDEPTRLLNAMVRAAAEAARYIRGRGSDLHALDWREKTSADFVSDVDTDAERRIREILLDDVGAAIVVGEELSPDGAQLVSRAARDARSAENRLRFVVDPLDGTTNFLHGYPAYAVSIAALLDDALAAAVVLNVPTGDVFTATAGGGAYRNDQRIGVSAIAEPARALIGTGFPFKNLELLDDYQHQFAAVMRRTAGIRRAGSAALDLADVACGRFDGFWELVLAPWDFLAGALLITEAGGVITDLTGRTLPQRPSAVVAGNAAMHRWLLGTLTTDPETDWT